MKLGVISRNIGVALVFNSLMMFVSVIVSICYGFDASFSPLFLSAIITLAAGTFPLIFVKKSGTPNLKEGFVVVVFAWILSCLFGMLPYVLWGGEFSLINAWFESVSGYTTTGSSILVNVEALPHGLLFWRSATHFIGGLGVVAFMLLVLPTAKDAYSVKLSKVEMSALSKENYKFKLFKTARVITIVYLAIIAIETLCLVFFSHMSFFDAINNSMSTAATGGFSVRNGSIAYYHSPSAEVIIIIFMYISGLHFGLIYSSFANRSLKIFRNPVVKFYTLGLVVCSFIIAINLMVGGSAHSFPTALRNAAFQLTSIASCTGFATDNASAWPALSILLLLYFTFQGACSGSTGGGIKADRICVFISSMKAQFRKQFHTNAVTRTRLGNRVLEDNFVLDVNAFIIFYIVIIFMVALLLAFCGVNIQDSFTASATSMGNCGLTLATFGSFGNYSAFPAFGKFILTFEMLLGRLEIYPLLMIFGVYKWK